MRCSPEHRGELRGELRDVFAFPDPTRTEITPLPPKLAMSEHTGQHQRCRACGTNPRGPQEQAMTESAPVVELCADCGASRIYAWSERAQRAVLRPCPCGAPKGDKASSRERIVELKAQLQSITKPPMETP